MATLSFAAGNYRFIPAVFQYSGGVAAEPGYRIERVTLRRPLPLVDGLRVIEGVVAAAGRPLTALCACELRSPAPFTEGGFRAFNETYVGALAQWGLFDGQINPVARSNVCPEVHPPTAPSVYAFAFTMPDADAPASFCIAGSGEAPEGKANYRDHIVRRGDVSEAGLREKGLWVLSEMERRMSLLGFGWPDTTAVQVYTVHDLYPLVASDIVARGAARHGLTWHYARPPIVDIDYEMDCRGAPTERLV
jgi:hypothetical protein